MTSKNVVSPIEANINPTFVEKPTEVIPERQVVPDFTLVMQAPESQAILRSGSDYPNEWSKGFFNIFTVHGWFFMKVCKFY